MNQPALEKHESSLIKVKPGNWDRLNTTELFESDNALGIPAMYHTPTSAIPDYLLPYRTRLRRKNVDLKQVGVHFWLDDHRFESTWNHPLKALESLKQYKVALTPDFSIYRDWPQAVNQFNVYRRRWLGCFWQRHQFLVIPTVSWGLPDTWDYCFLGLPPHSVLGISTIGSNLKDPIQVNHFTAGFKEMIMRLQPAALVVHGRLPEALHALTSAEVHEYPSQMYPKEGERPDQLQPRKHYVL